MFLELRMIRWVSSELSVFAYFKNFVLIACFLGFGTGSYLANRRTNLLAMLVPLVALAVICELPSPALREVRYQMPYMVGMIHRSTSGAYLPCQ
jgi:hypothetical protein